MARGLIDQPDTERAALRLLLLAAVLGVLAVPPEARAQRAGCVLQAAGSPARQVLRCREGLTVEAEAGADYTLLDRDRNGEPDAANLRRGALFVDTPTRARGHRFQVRTPQAVAAVRGTR